MFITAGMGGGTGTGAAPVIAKIARDLKILTIAIVTEPFNFEGKKRMDNTVKGLENLRKYVDTLIIIPNDKITCVVPKNTSMVDALRVADEILKQGIRGIADLIVNPALINLDFADVRTILKDQGLAHMGVGVAKGENRIVEAVRLAVNCPRLPSCRASSTIPRTSSSAPASTATSATKWKSPSLRRDSRIWKTCTIRRTSATYPAAISL